MLNLFIHTLCTGGRDSDWTRSKPRHLVIGMDTTPKCHVCFGWRLQTAIKAIIRIYLEFKCFSFSGLSFWHFFVPKGFTGFSFGWNSESKLAELSWGSDRGSSSCPCSGVSEACAGHLQCSRALANRHWHLGFSPVFPCISTLSPIPIISQS